jgi:hypothetical protein
MKIFFAHSMIDYGSDEEIKWLDNISKCYPGVEIINSRDVSDTINNDDRKHGLKYVEEKYFFPIIDNCDMVIATSSWIRKKFTIGVVVEMKYAMSKNKKIRIIENYEIIEVDNIEKYEDAVEYHIPGEDPVRMKDTIKRKGFVF